MAALVGQVLSPVLKPGPATVISLMSRSQISNGYFQLTRPDSLMHHAAPRIGG